MIQCDRMIVDLGAAASESQRLAQMVKEHRPLKQLTAAAASLSEARRAAPENTPPRSAESAGGGDATLAERADRIEDVSGRPGCGFARGGRSGAGQDASAPAGDDLTVRLEQFSEAMAGARRRATVLAIDLAQQHADRVVARTVRNGPHVAAGKGWPHARRAARFERARRTSSTMACGFVAFVSTAPPRRSTPNRSGRRRSTAASRRHPRRRAESG